MKLKGINLFEQHVEKIVLGVVAVVAVGFTARQFLTNPNAVNLGGRTLAPSEVDEALAQKARQLKQNLESSNSSIEYEHASSMSEWFREEHNRNLAGTDALPVALVRTTPLQVGESAAISGEVGLYAGFNPPAPAEPEVFARPYSLAEEVVRENPELQAMLPENPPFDLPVVHVFAKVNGKDIRESFLAPVEERSNIPSAWWDSDMSIMDIIVERQRLRPDETWSEIEIVSPIPGQQSVRDQIAEAKPTQLNSILSDVFTAAEGIYQPKFYDLIGGEEWTRKKVDELRPKSPELLDAIARMEAAWKTLRKAELALDRLLQAQDRENERGQSTPGRGEGGKGASGFGEGGEGGGASPDDREDEKNAQERAREVREERIQKALENYEYTKDDVLALDPEYAGFPDEEPREPERGRDAGRGGRDEGQAAPDMGEFGEGGVTFGGEGGGKGMIGRERSSRDRASRSRGGRDDYLPLLEDDSRDVWFHDVTVDPNAVYRYRVRVEYFNPFFGRKDRLAEEQKAFADSIVVSSEPSEWTDPIRVVSTKQFYIVNGRYDELLDGRRATAEIYVFTGGQERMSSMTLRVGEPIGELRTVTVMRAPSAEEEEDDPRGRDPRGFRDPGREEELEEVPTEIEIDFSTGAVLLDVIEVVASDDPNDRKVQVLVALEDGTIMAIDPDEHLRSEDRARLREMATKETNS